MDNKKLLKQTANSNLSNHWNNDDNTAFYEQVTPEGLKSIAEQLGLASGCDIEAIKPYWENAESILDAGAGYGRIIETLLRHNFTGKITAVERSKSLFDFLKNNFKNKVTTLQMNLYNCFQLKEKFDVIFLMWSGLLDFSSNEQSKIIQTLANLLNKNGKLIIDSMPLHILPMKAVEIGEQSYSFLYCGNKAYIYKASKKEIHNYAQMAGLKITSHLTIKTEMQRIREIYILMANFS